MGAGAGVLLKRSLPGTPAGLAPGWWPFDGNRPVVTGRAVFSRFVLSLVGGASLPSDRRLGTMIAVVARAWEEALRRQTPPW
jgi:hypothetical protein